MTSPPRIVAAACFLSHVQPILVSARHWDKVMRAQLRGIMGTCQATKPAAFWQEGFIDQHGTFYTRVQAMIVVGESGQPFDAERNGSTHELFSEGLY